MPNTKSNTNPLPPLVDTHVHLWDINRLRYGWLSGQLNRTFTIEDFYAAVKVSHANVERIIFVECGVDADQSLQEVAFVTEIAQSDSRLQGIVAQAALEQGDGILPMLETLAQNPLVKGVRRNLQGDGVDFCLSPDFVCGVQSLAQFGLHFEICIRHEQTASVAELARHCPDVRFMLNHIGKPAIGAKVLEPWASDITTLAALPNVWCKVSGMVTEADPQNWSPADLEPYLQTVVAAFGFDRLVYGGDWPVVLLAAEYPVWVSTVQELLKPYTDDERRRLCHDNAVAFYRLQRG